MRAILTALALLAAMLPAVVRAQAVFDDPAGLIAFAYAPYESGEFPEDYTALFSPTLKQLWDDMEARSEAAGEPIIDFDPFIDGQDYEITELLIADPVIDGDEAVVAVSFLNFNEPREIRFALVRRAEGWKIDDMESLSPEFGWRLSELLAADPLLN
jgi:hypothetical protein